MIEKDRRLSLPPDLMVRGGADAADSVEATDADQQPLADQFSSYLFDDDDLRLAFDVALASRRPLLIEGPSGSGKSTAARAAAVNLGWRFYRHTITSRTEATDLLWRVDHVRRLGDAQTGEFSDGLDVADYLTPGILWWAFDPTSAATVSGHRKTKLTDPCLQPSGSDSGNGEPTPAVVLLDHLDNAHPDMPSDLLGPLGALEFQVEILDGGSGPAVVRADPGAEPLIVITSNREQDLAPAFLRRCIRHQMKLPSIKSYLTIAQAQVPDIPERSLELVSLALVQTDKTPDRQISIARFVDAVRAFARLELDPSSDEGTRLLSMFRMLPSDEFDPWP